MQEKKPDGMNTGQDKSSKVDNSGYETKQSPRELQNKANDQSYTDQQGEVNQPVHDKRAFDDKQVDVPMAPPKFADPVVRKLWFAVDKSSNESGTPNDEILKKPVLSLDNIAQHVNQLAPETDAQAATNWGTGAGKDSSTASTRLADEWTKVGLPGGDSAGGVVDPGTVIVGIPEIIREVPNPATIIGTDTVDHGHVWRHLMDPLYVLDPVAITLSGGGAFGAFEVGALDFIYNRFMGSVEGVAVGFSRPRPDIVTGTSIGAVNGAWISQGDGSMEELKNLWFGLSRNEDMFLLNSAFDDLIADPGERFGPAIGKIVADAGMGFLASMFVPLGFLFFGQVGADISDLYNRLSAQSSVYNLEPIKKVLQEREAHWSPTGPGLRGASVSAACDAHGHRIIFARGYDDMLYVRWQLDIGPVSVTTQWSLWQTLGGPISSDPVAYHTFRHGVGVIARQGNGQYGAREFDHPDVTLGLDYWYQWQTVPVPSSTWNVVDPHGPSQPHVVQRAPDGGAWAFCCDNMGHAYYSANGNGYWGPWTSAGHGIGIANNISGCSHWDGTLDLFARATDNSLRHSFTAGSSTTLGDWVTLGGQASSDVLVVNDDVDYIVDIFWRGPGGEVWTQRKTGGAVGSASWGGQRRLGGMITSNLSSGRNSDGTYTIFARGLDDLLYALRQPARNAEWPTDAWEFVGAPQGLKLLADPYTLARSAASLFPTDRVEVYAVASDHSVWTISQQVGEPFSQWFSLGGKVWTGIQLRMSTVALEAVEDRFVDEAGRFVGTLEPIVSRNGDISFSRTEGIIASSSLPGLFPPVRLNGRTWVDGGVRRGVPIGAAIDAGAKRVIAISTAPTTISPVERILQRTLGNPFSQGLIEDYSDAGIIDIAMRSLTTLVDAIHWAEIAPETKWPVPVSVIQPTFKIKGGDAINPGLIRINYAYGWMRAFDILVASDDDRREAIASTDTIIELRLRIWNYEAGLRETYLIATWPQAARPASNNEFAGWSAGSIEGIVHQLRAMKRQLTQHLIARRDAGFQLDPETPQRLQGFESYTRPAHWNDEWARHSFPYTSVFDDISFRGLDGRDYHIIPDADPPPTI